MASLVDTWQILHERLAQLWTTTVVREPTPFGANFDDFHELCTTVCHQTEWLMKTQDRLVEQRDSLLDRVRASRDELRQAQNELHTHVAELAAERRSHAEERGIRLANLEKLWVRQSPSLHAHCILLMVVRVCSYPGDDGRYTKRYEYREEGIVSGETCYG